jgi:hypothetical protein
MEKGLCLLQLRINFLNCNSWSHLVELLVRVMGLPNSPYTEQRKQTLTNTYTLYLVT